MGRTDWLPRRKLEKKRICECGKPAEYWIDPVTGKRTEIGRCKDCYEKQTARVTRESQTPNKRT